MRRRAVVAVLFAAVFAGGCAQPAAQPPSPDVALDVTGMGDALASIDDLTALADEADDLDQLATDEAIDDPFVLDEDPDFADLATPDFDQELDLGE